MKKNWIWFWEKLEQNGNVGIDYIINPVLYPKINDFLTNSPKATIIDFGAGTMALGLDLLYGNQLRVPGLKACRNLEKSRKNIDYFIGLEKTKELVNRAKIYLHKIGSPNNLLVKSFDIKDKQITPCKKQSVDLCVSRNFIMHISSADLQYHLQEAHRILKNNGAYIFSVLNPEYEMKKYLELYPNDKKLQNHTLYTFPHGERGEYGTIPQYWRSTKVFEQIIKNQSFAIKEKTPCFPADNKFKKKYPRYYKKDCPMAIIYSLTKK